MTTMQTTTAPEASAFNDKRGTGIEWAAQGLPLTIGCEKVSEGCRNCWAERLIGTRFVGKANAAFARGVTPAETFGLALEVINDKGGWNGKVRLLEKNLRAPLSRRRPERYFVCPNSDLFHESVPYDYIDQAMAVFALTPRHRYLLLTKRALHSAAYIQAAGRHNSIELAAEAWRDGQKYRCSWPLRNVWLGFSAENQERFDERWEHIEPLARAGWNVFVSLEPLLGPVTLPRSFLELGPKAWVIAGGESGADARVCNVVWLRKTLEDCAAHGVPMFIKQLGSKPAIWSYADEYDDDLLVCRNCCTGQTWTDADCLGGDDAVYKTNKAGKIVSVVREQECFCWKCGESNHRNGPQYIKHTRGGDMNEWPVGLRVRQVPLSARLPWEKTTKETTV